MTWARPVIFTMVIAALCAGCGPVVKTATPLGEAISSDRGDYRIAPMDELRIEFLTDETFGRVVRVRPDGRISLQNGIELKVAGRTIHEATGAIASAYGKFMRDPWVSLEVNTFAAQRTFVGGEVDKPGVQPLVGPTTLLQAITVAGGFKDTARTDEVVIIRYNTDGRRIVFSVNVDDVISGRDLHQDVELMAQDMVFVPRSDIANVDLWVDQYVRKALPLSSSSSFGYTMGKTQ